MVRLTLMYYIDFIAFMENPDKTWEDILAKGDKKHRQSLPYLIRGACFWEKKARSLNLLGFGHDLFALLSFTGQQ